MAKKKEVIAAPVLDWPGSRRQFDKPVLPFQKVESFEAEEENDGWYNKLIWVLNAC